LSRTRTALAVALVGLCALAPGVAHAANSTPTVMTRNLYLGASLTPIAQATTPAEVQAAALAALGKALGPNLFANRVGAIAAEINATKPDLIGLQEVSTFRDAGGNVLIDYEQVLLFVLNGSYSPVDERVEANLGVPGVGSLEISNVILKRNGAPTVTVTNPRGAAFQNQISFLGVPLARNWQAVDAQVGPKDFTFLNTHLESENDAVSTAQARELIAGPLRSTKPVIAVGDFNSGPGAPEQGAFRALTAPNQGKLRDAGNVGFTCCFPEVLTNLGTLTQKIDFVFSSPAAVKTVATQRVGAAQVGGLYPSDHAGVVATLRVP